MQNYSFHFFRTALVISCSLLVVSSTYALSVDLESARTITAERIEFDRRSQAIRTVGQAEMETADGQRMTWSDAHMEQRGALAGGDNVQVWLGRRTFFSAERADRTDNITTAARVTYTACEDCDDGINAWEVTASRMRHDTDTRVMQFYNAVFWAYNIPIFWSPYLAYPDPTVRRRSGLLIPYMNTTTGMGTQINFPVYIALSDMHDFTFTPAHLTGENPLWQIEHRLNAERSQFRTTGSYTRNRAGNNRWHVFNNDVIELGDHARATIFLQRTSDKTYLQRYGFYDAQPFLDSGGRVEVFADSGYVRASAHTFQELRVNPNRRTISQSGDILPNIHGVFQTAPLYADTYAFFTGDMIGIYNSQNADRMQRILGSVGVASPWIIRGGQRITLSAQARYDIYYFDNADMTRFEGDPNFTGTKTRFLPSGYIEWALPLINNSSENWTHVLKPRARFTMMRVLDSPAFTDIDSAGSVLSDATLFSNNRFAGYDLWVNSNYADYGIDWSAFSANGISVSGFAGQTYDFSETAGLDPNSGFHAGRSDFVGRLSLEYKNWFAINNRARFYRDSFALRHIESMARFGKTDFIEAGYIMAVQLSDPFTEESRQNEIAGGFGTGLTERWRLRARTTYNITDERIQRQQAGLYYEHPCYMLGLEYARDGAIRRGFGVDENYVGTTTIKLVFSLRLVEGRR